MNLYIRGETAVLGIWRANQQACSRSFHTTMVRRKYMYVLVLSVFLEVLLNLETALHVPLI